MHLQFRQHFEQEADDQAWNIVSSFPDRSNDFALQDERNTSPIGGQMTTYHRRASALPHFAIGIASNML
jgi:hypothetical protein